MTELNLKPCPFCGKPAEYIVHKPPESWVPTIHEAGCIKCVMFRAYSKAEAIRLWERRV